MVCTNGTLTYLILGFIGLGDAKDHPLMSLNAGSPMIIGTAEIKVPFLPLLTVLQRNDTFKPLLLLL